MNEIDKTDPEDKTKLLLKADVDVEYGRIVDVMNEIKDAEIEIIGLVVDKVSH